jgi:hypothetical protein
MSPIMSLLFQMTAQISTWQNLQFNRTLRNVPHKLTSTPDYTEALQVASIVLAAVSQSIAFWEWQRQWIFRSWCSWRNIMPSYLKVNRPTLEDNSFLAILLASTINAVWLGIQVQSVVGHISGICTYSCLIHFYLHNNCSVLKYIYISFWQQCTFYFSDTSHQ